MCGFVGYLNQTDVDTDVIKSMADRIKHRGPDDEAYFQNEDASLGFRRLSIIDLAHGKQPMLNATKTKVLTFNGEIYNYQEIREELKALGYKFQTDVDSEVLIHGYDAWGPELLQKLRGMYAFVIYDMEKKEVFGARDHFGIKPLYYYDDGTSFLWGSEIKAFLDHPKFVKEFNERLLPIHLSFEFIPSKETMFKNVFKLLPGTYFLHKNGKTETHTYYKFNYDHIDNSQTVEGDAKQIRGIVKDSVKAHMIADVEVGSFLSSGIDSSYVLAEAAKLKPIQSFSLGFNDSKYSELSYSTEFAKEIHQQNTPLTMDGDDYFDILPTIMYYMDEPLSNPSAMQLYYLSKGTREHVKVALSGEGADEFFGGYNTYLEAFPFERYQKWVPQFVRTGLAKLVQNLPRFHGKRFLVRGAEPLSERYYRVNYVFDKHERDEILRDPSINVDSGEYTKHIFDEVKGKDEMTQMQYFDINTWLPFDILHKADRMSMANSLEVRTPLVDKEVAKFAATMPVNTRIHKDETKISLRTAAESELPERVAKKEKMGFPSPIASWIKEDKYRKRIETAFNSDVAKKFFKPEALMHILHEHINGKSSMQKIFTIYTFILWYEVFFPENTTATTSKLVHRTQV
ncbi:asparagine synthase (glutamine-hydrolyzing) [Pediococcus inopinatus]|uniref:asparagine synthase (glutamine-hydrolyzing) n=1 Tax=Pediococcus inopinatus TaxID=114090 RepID=A0ABZ0Q623_9LACO|nr:asparagine synthase (glutamine-hydrolyzing) [Pediococcus inopinatus]AVK99720.1 asparagine synthase (glutamine-hydrolyzing) [Pediococcus inopinatus]KRN60485.1 asparagine synthase [Pediococcus inopinatus]WPC17443.1 asparagine synthase (glutamine-hydrolyzing) [Pediococcus inopinatus]WPC18814.1 asparagine synthase (glutamine-hydrolyzing) [Pediococcus inopinatus]WPC22431.1 asparagine synthase (glutamine-hydrolyzing) [Pediococcus inopinatus]